MLAPAALVAVPLLAGAVAAIALFDHLGPQAAWPAAGGALLALTSGIGAAAQDDRWEAAAAIGAGALCVGLSLGVEAAARAYDPPLLRWFTARTPREPVTIEGILREDAAITAFGASLVVDVLQVREAGRPETRGAPGSRETIGGVRLSVGGALLSAHASRWRAGRRIRAPASLRLPATYLNPGVRSERRALARRGIVLVGSVKSAALVEVAGQGSGIAERAASIRAWTRAAIARHVGALDAKSGGLATAVLIGDRSGLSEEDERRLQEAGTYHVVAISGGNIAILAALIVGAGRVLMIGGRPAAVVTCAVLLFYGVVAAGAASVARAVTVAVLILGARAADHRGSSLNALAMAAVIAVAAVPVVAVDAGFVLSFGATLGILLGMPRIAPFRRVRPSDGGGIRAAPRAGAALTAVVALCAASVCAEVALLPVGATLFARVPMAGLVLNLAAIPLMTVVQIGGLLVAATGWWWDAGARMAAMVTHLAARGLLRSAEVMDVAPWLALDARPPSLWLVGTYYASALALLALPIRRTAAVALAAGAGLILAGFPLTTRDAVAPAPVPLRVVVLDVGQGDATLVALPDGAALLVDGGGLAPLAPAAPAADPPRGFDIGERIVTRALRALGVRRLHGIVVTHGDPDHILGVAGVLRRVAAASIWEGVPVPPHAGMQRLMSAARAGGLSWRTVQAGDQERFGDVEIRVLHPPPPEWERQRVRNEDSVVLEIRLGDVSVILPGDIGAEGERAILRRLEAGRLVVLKAPHHGSATSSSRELLDVLRPAAVIFSCGRDNRFGHPHPAVVARYKGVGAEMFSTAEDGAVFVETDGRTVALRGWTGRRATLTRRPIRGA